MNEISTWSVLKEFGFSAEKSAYTDESDLCFDFGNFKLSACLTTSKWFRPTVLFQGIKATPRTLADICFELPHMVASRQHLAALLVYVVDQYHPTCMAEWISEGRQHRHLLPWGVAQASYNTRPYCVVEREWLRLGLRTLAALLETADPEAEVEISFDGSVLLICCAGKVVPVSADGKSWDKHFIVPAGRLRQLPKRLTRDRVAISVQDGRLCIGRVCFGPCTEKPQ